MHVESVDTFLHARDRYKMSPVYLIERLKELQIRSIK